MPPTQTDRLALGDDAAVDLFVSPVRDQPPEEPSVSPLGLLALLRRAGLHHLRNLGRATRARRSGVALTVISNLGLGVVDDGDDVLALELEEQPNRVWTLFEDAGLQHVFLQLVLLGRLSDTGEHLLERHARDEHAPAPVMNRTRRNCDGLPVSITRLHLGHDDLPGPQPTPPAGSGSTTPPRSHRITARSALE